MLRKLLTLLAIITGLTATHAPAHARISAVEDVRLEASAEIAQNCTASARQELVQAGKWFARSANPENFCPRPTITIVVPTVYIGADRAYE